MPSGQRKLAPGGITICVAAVIVVPVIVVNAPAAGVVAEAMVALTLAQAMLEKFGGDSIAETRRNLQSFIAAIPELLKTNNVTVA